MKRTTLCFSLSTWTQQDPVGGSLGNPSSLDRYVYTQDNPVNLSDSSGRAPCSVLVGFGALVTSFGSSIVAFDAGATVLGGLAEGAGFAAAYGALVGSALFVGSAFVALGAVAVVAACLTNQA